MRSDLLNAPVYKFSGRIEHWLTTFHRGFWGLPDGERSKWESISAGDVFLFHGTKPEYINDNDAGGGVIGVGVVGGFDTKDEAVWLEELQGGRDYPYLIYFEEMYWFGDSDAVENIPVSEKEEAQIIDECHALSENILTFGEMREDAGYSFNPMGVMSEVKEIQKLRPLLEGRLRDLEADERDTPSAAHASESDGEFVTSQPGSTDTGGLDSGTRQERGGGSSTSSGQSGSSGGSSSGSRRDRSGADDLEVTGDETEVSFVRDTADTQRKNQEHERILDVVEETLGDSGFTVEETEYSDLIATRDDTHLLAEAKYIHEGNERDQIRYAIGQLAEYRYRDFRLDDLDDDPLRFLVLSQRPTDGYARFLKDLQNEGIYTVWVDDDAIKGPSESASVFSDLL
ncbi:hypothetical protein [Halorubrum lipolyticum]|uniref:Uncharacterized protein n=1 Tax=Halorubrum lipolyticum DSM 21995 TaxID=1227482 RepID=M0NGR4_9EURY|nr:hypothetical protein [Halorubrum lipolyticum]EMA57172.1 hypothetical protein C469_15608 [Halorubrum lipolyticum DSM 21995]